MSSYIRTIAQSLADGLAAVEFEAVDDQPTVSRLNWARVDTSAMASPVVFVTPGAAQLIRVSRGVTQADYEVQVFVGRNVETESDADDMLDLADEIMLHIRAHDWDESVTWPENVTSPMSVGIELNPDDALNERNTWRAVITASYRVFQPDQLPE